MVVVVVVVVAVVAVVAVVVNVIDDDDVVVDIVVRCRGGMPAERCLPNIGPTYTLPRVDRCRAS